MGTALIVGLSAFTKNIIGIITRPYETCRHIVDRGTPAELVYIAALLVIYFSIASMVKISAFRPFLLTRQFVLLAVATGLTYCVTVAAFWIGSRIMHATGTLKGFAIIWGYSLVPTLVWFVVTSILYIVLPPPRTTSIEGVIFSLLFLVFTATLFLWKATIVYLAVRFGFRLALGKVILLYVIVTPFVGAYSYGMYRLGIFRVPFL